MNLGDDFDIAVEKRGFWQSWMRQRKADMEADRGTPVKDREAWASILGPRGRLLTKSEVAEINRGYTTIDPEGGVFCIRPCAVMRQAMTAAHASLACRLKRPVTAEEAFHELMRVAALRLQEEQQEHPTTCSSSMSFEQARNGRDAWECYAENPSALNDQAAHIDHTQLRSLLDLALGVARRRLAQKAQV